MTRDKVFEFLDKVKEDALIKPNGDVVFSNRAIIEVCNFTDNLQTELTAERKKSKRLREALERAEEILDGYRCDIDDHCLESQGHWDYVWKLVRQALSDQEEL